MHVALSLPDAAAAYDAGWAEPHLYAGRTLGGGVSLPAGMVLVYAPRTAEEVRTPPLLPIPSRRAPRACRHSPRCRRLAGARHRARRLGRICAVGACSRTSIAATMAPVSTDALLSLLLLSHCPLATSASQTSVTLIACEVGHDRRVAA